MAGLDSIRRVIVCTNFYLPNFIGGAELIAHYQAKQLAAMGLEVRIFTGEVSCERPRYQLSEEEYGGLTVHRISLRPEDYDRDEVNFFHGEVEDRFDSLLGRFNPDVVHFHNILGLSVGLVPLAKTRGILTVLTVHDHWGYCYKNTMIDNDGTFCVEPGDCSKCVPVVFAEGKNIPIRMRQDYIRLMLEYVDVFISPSRYLADSYLRRGIGHGRFHVIWNGINVEKFVNITKKQSEKVRFTFVGLLGEHKGIKIFLKALSLLKDEDEIFFNLVGSGPLLDYSKEYVRSIGCERKVRFWGRIDNSQIGDVYEETDVLLLPSVWPENQPVTITEAMASGIPVIASDAGGIGELVENGRTGLLFEPGNAQHLAKSIKTFVQNKESIKEYGEEAAKRMARNTFSSQVREILTLYRTASRSKPSDTASVLVLGENIAPVFQESLSFLRDVNGPRPFFVHIDWLNNMPENGHIFWVVGQEKPEHVLELAREHGLALLVPADGGALMDYCRRQKCGLYYEDPLEAAVCLEYLLSHENICRTMGDNACGRCFRR